jgi:hypothetical protein
MAEGAGAGDSSWGPWQEEQASLLMLLLPLLLVPLLMQLQLHWVVVLVTVGAVSSCPLRCWPVMVAAVLLMLGAM